VLIYPEHSVQFMQQFGTVQDVLFCFIIGVFLTSKAQSVLHAWIYC